MRKQGLAMPPLRCSCGLRTPVKQIRIGNGIVGLVGLDEILQQLHLLDRPPDAKTADELLAMVKERNYVPPRLIEDYKAALLREYTAYRATKSKGGKP